MRRTRRVPRLFVADDLDEPATVALAVEPDEEDPLPGAERGATVEAAVSAEPARRRRERIRAVSSSALTAASRTTPYSTAWSWSSPMRLSARSAPGEITRPVTLPRAGSPSRLVTRP